MLRDRPLVLDSVPSGLPNRAHLMQIEAPRLGEKYSCRCVWTSMLRRSRDLEGSKV